MNLSQTIVKKNEELTSGLALQGFHSLTTEDIDNMIADCEKQSYDYYLHMSPKSGLVKLLIESAKAYGEAKWNEAVVATRRCEDLSRHPKFIP
jgi:hypothetical protein